MVFLGTQKGRNATALLTTLEEALGRVGLSELAREGIYNINIHKEIQSALLEVNRVLGMHIPDLTAEQESAQEQIGVRIGQACNNARFDFQIDKRIDKKTYKQGRLAAKWAAKLMLQEWLPELSDEHDWID